MNWPVLMAAAAVLASTSGARLFPRDHNGTTRQALDHPAVALLDSTGAPASRSGGPVSARRTCGGCHDTGYIATHSYHAATGASDRHPGGGASAAGGTEFNCFLCHLEEPDNGARIAAVESGQPWWAVTATLARTGLVARDGTGWRYDRVRFDADGHPREPLAVVAPASRHCGTCHGLVHDGDDPVDPRYGRGEMATERSGQIFSPQRIGDSAMNVAGKDTLTRPWDVHAERLLDCTSCHFSLNDPAYAAAPAERRPQHLAFDGRRQDIAEFLRRPSHHFAKGYSAYHSAADELDGTMRRCEDCHNAATTHTWLPYTQHHLERVMCESCHIPRVHAPALQAEDWTVVDLEGQPRREYRGLRDTPGPPGDPKVLIEGYRPLLVPRRTGGDSPRIGPVNVVATWYWTSGGERVERRDLQRAFVDGGAYHPDIVAAFDTDGDGDVSATERVIDSERKHNAARARLEAIGVTAPRIEGTLQPYGLHHTVVSGRWATRDCSTCHDAASVLAEPFVLATVAPGGVTPTAVAGTNVTLGGTIKATEGGGVVVVPGTGEHGFYVLGHDRWHVGDVAGVLMIIAVVLGALVHGGLRYHHARTRRETT